MSQVCDRFRRVGDGLSLQLCGRPRPCPDHENACAEVPTFPHIELEGQVMPISNRSIAEGVTSRPYEYRNVPLPCTGCGEDLVDGPCRLGAAECWSCGRKYPYVMRPLA
jgi:hypothetical protein